MKLISRVVVKSFRSIAEIDLQLQPLTALVGGNGSGKSNVLRALNLFFNDEVERGHPMKLGRDAHRFWNQKRLQIEVGAEFSLPPNFNIHTALRDSLESIGIRRESRVAITKRWTPGAGPDEPPQLELLIAEDLDTAPTILEGENAKAAERFLRLIHFRYLPNHQHPSSVLASEQAAVQEALIKALRRKRAKDAAGEGAGQRFDAALRAMAEAASVLVEPINASLGPAAGLVESLALATPEDWEQVAWTFNFHLKATGLEPIDFEVHGSGSQSQVMYQMLYFLDTRFAESFGWHQATVWALEEPESFLHADLKNDLAVFLIERSETQRFQAIMTTHDLMLAAAAGERQWIELTSGSTAAESLDTPSLAKRSIAEGVSTYMHPLHLTAMKPTLLLEGPSDVWYVQEAYRQSARTNPWDLRYLGEIEEGAGGGKDSIKKYLKQNQAALRARPPQSPVIVVLDWEVGDGEVQAIATLVEAHPTSTARRWPSDHADALLGDSFVGIERFLSPDLIREAGKRDPGAGITFTADDPPRMELQPQKKTGAKTLIQRVCAERDSADDLQPLIELLPWLETMLPHPLSQTPIPGL